MMVITNIHANLETNRERERKGSGLGFPITGSALGRPYESKTFIFRQNLWSKTLQKGEFQKQQPHLKVKYHMDLSLNYLEGLQSRLKISLLTDKEGETKNSQWLEPLVEKLPCHLHVRSCKFQIWIRIIYCFI